MSRLQPIPRPRPLAYHQLPRFFRPKLKPADQLRAGIIQWDLISRFVDGTATREILWDWIETGLTYCQMMQLLTADGLAFEPEAVEAINAQIESYDAVIARYTATGRVGFSAPELATARAAALVMDALLLLDRNGIADQAGRWAVAQMHALRTTGRLPRPGRPA
jgi:hypothetical protein